MSRADADAYLAAYLADPARDETLLRRALTADPHLASAHFALAVRHFTESNEAAAITAFKRSLALAPDAAAAHANLAALHEARGEIAEALAPARRAVMIEPVEARFHANFASFLAKTDQPDLALSAYRAALALDPSFYKTGLDYGITLTEIGRRDGAGLWFRRMGALATGAVRPVRLYAELEKVTADSPVFGMLARFDGRQDRLSPADRSELGFALGKSFADLGDTASAFAALRGANALRRGLVSYDEAAELGHLRTIAARFTAEAIAAARAESSAGDQPVFIVGMPRCGSTLVEQVLASHPDVAAMGESKALSLLIKRHGPAGFRQVGGAYLAEVTRTYPSARRVTDKMLGNFTRLGFIAAALPGARIVHIRRDPIDCCMSIHSRHFLEGHAYAGDLGELGRYYRAYDQLMAHWRQVLPEGMMIELDYERIVEDLPGQARLLLDFLGLDWDARCLDFHKTERMVRTASQGQVRAPLTREGIGRWHPYIPYIGPLLDALGPLAYKDGA